MSPGATKKSFWASYSRFSVGVVLNSTLRLADSYRLTAVYWILMMVSCKKVLVQNTGNGCIMYNPGSMRQAWLGIRYSMISLGCFMDNQALAWHNFPPLWQFFNTPHRVLMLEVEINILPMFVLPLLVLFELDSELHFRFFGVILTL